MKKYIPIITSAAVALLVSAIAIGLYHYSQNTDAQRISEFYHTEVATLVSPHGLRKDIAKGEQDFVLVDVRSQEEYEEEHIIGAVNVPAYVDPDTSAYGDVERIVKGFEDIMSEYPNRDIIIYCYSTACMSGRKVGKMISDHGIYVKELGIGWNEWRYDWNAWNHPHEWDVTDVRDYIASGDQPGVYSALPGIDEGCSLSAEFDC
ncbi:MAG: rhodanese-related sulfurtransferase [Candidatus Paceibacteria bacterium]|jgi:rhodanese-related sulfurtransferase